LNLRAGVIGDLIKYNFYRLSSEHEGDPLQEDLNTSGKTSTQQAFAQWQYKPSNNITLNAGMHYFRLLIIILHLLSRVFLPNGILITRAVLQ
jgi:hypothetical protein